MQISAGNIVNHYGMQPHPEGGYFKETYRSAELIERDALPGRFTAGRHFSTAIYFLLEKGQFSAFHRIKSDECWHFYAGGTLLIYVIDPVGQLQVIKLGDDISHGETFQHVVPAGCWFGAAPAKGTAFSFVGCTVAPGFDFADFELAKRDALARKHPHLALIIEKLTRI